MFNDLFNKIWLFSYVLDLFTGHHVINVREILDFRGGGVR